MRRRRTPSSRRRLSALADAGPIPAPTPAPRRGRPPGSKNVEHYATVVLSRCPVCKSTARGNYETLKIETPNGKTGDGLPFNRRLTRRTRCKTCGTPRFDTFLQYEPQNNRVSLLKPAPEEKTACPPIKAGVI